MEPPNKKRKPDTPTKKSETVKPEDDTDVSDTDVSDVEVSDVSSVEDSSDSSDDSDSEDEEDKNESDSDSSSSSSSSSDDIASDSSSDEEDAEQIQRQRAEAAKKKAAAAAAAAAAWVPTPPKKLAKVDIQVTKGSDGAQALSAGKPFQRVDDQYWGDVATKDGGAMADNSYEGVFGEEGFGARASNKLLQVRGKRFQHEKTKAKRSYNGFARTGQGIKMNSNSTKFLYDD